MAKKDNGKMGHNSNLSDPELDKEIIAHRKDVADLEKIKKEANDKLIAKKRSFKTLTGISNKEFQEGRSDAEIENPNEQKKIINNKVRVFNALSGSDQISMEFNYPDEIQDEDDDTNADD